MHEMQSDSLHLISLLLQYPDEEMFGRIEELDSAASHLCSSEIRPIIEAFLEDLGTLTPIQTQERYTAVFDMDPATTLNLTYHMYGDNEKRAEALARLQHHYEQAGWERITGELPDYLPMMLEFLSICQHPEHTAFVWQCLQGLQTVVDGLKKRAPAYAALLQPIARMAVERCASIEKGELSLKAKA